MQPHGIELGLTLELIKKRKKVKSTKSTFQAMIEIEDDKKRGKLVLPMRSFNKLMLEWLRQMLAGTPIGTYIDGTTSGITIPAKTKVILNASTANTQATRKGIVLGASTSNYLEPSAIELKGLIPNTTTATAGALTYLPTTLVPIVNVSNRWGFTVKRVIQNNTSGEIWADVMALRAKNVSNASTYDIALDPFYPSSSEGGNGRFYFDGLSSATISFNFYIEPETLPYGSNTIILGGLTKNFTDLMLNLLFQGSTSFNMVKYTGVAQIYTIPGNKGASNVSNMLNLIPSTTTLNTKGIVTLYNPSDLPDESLPPSFPSNVISIGSGTGVTNLTAGTNYVSAIEIVGNAVTFTIHRDFTNNTSSNIDITRVGLISGRGNTGEILLAQNRVYNTTSSDGIRSPITVPPTETLRISYKFTTEM